MKKILLLIAAICGVFSLTAANIFLAGDSTCAKYPPERAPQNGWGQVLESYCKPGVKVTDRAAGGCSSKSFITQKRWASLLKSAKPGDFVIVQFGHNDNHKDTETRIRHTDPETTYKEWLRTYVKDAKEKQLKLVFATPVATSRYKKGVKIEVLNLPAYAKAMKEVAAETGTPVVDLFTVLTDEVTKMGEEKAHGYYMFVKAADFPNLKLKKDQKDHVHLRVEGANWVAQTFVRLAKEQKLEIAECFK